MENSKLISLENERKNISEQIFQFNDDVFSNHRIDYIRYNYLLKELVAIDNQIRSIQNTQVSS